MIVDVPPQTPETVAELDAAIVALGNLAKTGGRLKKSRQEALANLIGGLPASPAQASAWKSSLKGLRKELVEMDGPTPPAAPALQAQTSGLQAQPAPQTPHPPPPVEAQRPTLVEPHGPELQSQTAQLRRRIVDAPAPTQRRRSVYLDDAIDRRLADHCRRERRAPSDVIAEAVAFYLGAKHR
jgi:hypothetical protein